MIKRWFLAGIMLLLVFILIASCGMPKEDYEAMVAERDAAQTRIASLQNDLYNAQGQIETLQSNLSETQNQIETLKTNLSEAEDQIESLQSSMAANMDVMSRALSQALQGDVTLQSVSMNSRLGRSLNDFFNAFSRLPHGLTYERVDLDDYWTADGLILPADLGLIAAHTKRIYSYGGCSIYGRLPTPVAPGSGYFGFEPGGGVLLPFAQFKITSSGVYCYGGQYPPSTINQLDITSLLPADYATADHTYTVKMNRASALFFVDGSLVGVLLFGVSDAIPDWENKHPYALGAVSSPMTANSGAAMIELIDDGENGQVFPLNIIADMRFEAHDGDPCPPQQFPLYNENTATKWSSSVTGSSLLTSHPVPVWGYTNKTLLFQSDGVGTLIVQIYAGGAWVTVDTLPVKTNKLLTYKLTCETPIARCIYDPTDGSTISVAEWNLS